MALKMSLIVFRNKKVLRKLRFTNYRTNNLSFKF